MTTASRVNAKPECCRSNCLSSPSPHRQIVLAIALLYGIILIGSTTSASESQRKFRVWAVSDSHVSADARRGRESLAIPIRQAAGLVDGAVPFDWDIMLDGGDHCGGQFPPDEKDGRMLVRQYRALTGHYREDVYQVAGNHDGDYYDQGPGSWFGKWLDPIGIHTRFSEVHPQLRRFPVEGTWEHYKFEAGNILFLMMSDYNCAVAPVGRGHSKDQLKGGFPAGAVTRDTFNWWKQQVLENQDKIIITMHHHMLRDTTTWARFITERGFHGASGGFEGSGYLYFIVENPDPQNFKYTKDAHAFEDFLDDFHRKHGKPAIDLWLGGHSHPEDPAHEEFGQGLTEKKWGVTFVQCGALTMWHGGFLPMSRLLTFTPDSHKLNIQMYLHETSARKSKKKYTIGWHKPAATEVTLRHKHIAPQKDTRPAPPKYKYEPLVKIKKHGQ